MGITLAVVAPPPGGLAGPAGWEPMARLLQLEQSRALNYDFLSPNLCCSRAAQQRAASSSAHSVPPCAVTVETTGLRRPHKAALT